MTIGVFRVAGIECVVQKPFQNNGKLVFKREKNTNLVASLERRLGVRGAARAISDFERHNILPFTSAGSHVKEVYDYKTIFGPTIYCGAVCYTSRSIVNLAKAITRVTSCRSPEVPGLCEQLRRNQDLTFRLDHPGEFGAQLRLYWASLRLHIGQCVQELGTFSDAVEETAFRKHTKRRARMQAYTQLREFGNLHVPDRFMKRVVGKVKCPESAKPGKYPRLVGDFSCPGSLLGGAIMECIKHAFEKWYECPGFKCRFVYSADRENLNDCYEQLINGRGFVGVFHSDDMCAKIPCVDGDLRANLDISSCDSSNGVRVFDLMCQLVEGTAWHGVVLSVRDQCLKDVKVTNPLNPLESLTLENGGEPIEYSGTTATTVLNNIASFGILMSIFIACQGATIAEARQLIPRAAASIGYIVSVEEIEVIEDFQFLKTSPYLVDGVVECFTNLGVIARCIGSCDGDLPGRGPIGPRGFARNCQIVAGLIHAGDNCFTQLLRKMFPLVGGAPVSVHWLLDTMSGFESNYVSIEVICRRYRVSSCDVEHFLEILAKAKTGDVIRTRFTDAVYAKDYGYTFADRAQP